MKKRTLLFTSLALILVAAISIGGTMAYFTANKTVTNTFTVGGINIDLLEPSWSTSEPEALNMVPGDSVDKDPQVKNTGVSPCYVRLKVTGLTYDETILAPAGFKVLGANLTNWTYSDGYYYYNITLVPNATTPALFTGIELDSAVEGNVGNFNIVVYAEAVQCEGDFAPGDIFLASAKAAFNTQISTPV